MKPTDKEIAKALKDEEPICRYIGRPCIKHACHHYQKLTGHHPQTGAPIDEYMCSDLWNNILLIECTQMAKQTGAATESMRNEIVARMDSVKPLKLVKDDGREAFPKL